MSKPIPKDKWIEKSCMECNAPFFPKSFYKKEVFCSQTCANRYNWRHRERRQKNIKKKTCLTCGEEFVCSPKYSSIQWASKKFCSAKCFNATNKIHDGMTTPERSRRKRGIVKKGTEAWIEKIKAKTKEGMMKPEVIEKLQRPKGPLSEGTKMKLSDALIGIKPKNLSLGGAYPNIQRGTYECSKGSIYFRSKWEANYALYLDFLVRQGEILNWEFEPDIFFFEQIRLGTRSYTPDFKVFNPDDTIEYHEVKGYMDAKSKTKLKRMDLYFPDVKLILIERTFYMEIIKKLKGIIRFY